MPIKFECPYCGNRAQAPEALAGKRAKCPNCQSVLQIPGGESAAQADFDFADRPAAREAPAEAGGDDRRPCPMCGEMIKVDAVKCRFCGEIFDEELKRAERRRGRSRGRDVDYDTDMTTAEWLVAILCSGIGCIIGVVWMIQGKPKGTKMFGVSFLMAIFWNVVRFAIEAGMKGGR